MFQLFFLVLAEQKMAKLKGANKWLNKLTTSNQLNLNANQTKKIYCEI